MKRLTVFWVSLGIAATACARTFHVDSAGGNDAADGLTPVTAWRSLDRVNAATVEPGDEVRFRRGGLWRGTLRAKSGAPGRPILYSSYGKGPKPIIQRSLGRNAETDWLPCGPGLWTSPIVEPAVYEKVWDGTACNGWGACFQEGAKGRVTKVTEDGVTFVRVACTDMPRLNANFIQLWGPTMPAKLPDTCLLTLKVRCNRPFQLGGVRLALSSPPWTAGWSGSVRAKDGNTVTTEWRTMTALLNRVSGDVFETHFHIYLGDVLEKGSNFDFIPVEIRRASVDTSRALLHDVGIFICNHGEKWGVKRWSLAALRDQLDFWDDRVNERVVVKCDENPARRFSSIELALTDCVVNESGCHDVTFDGLCVRYGGAHGWGGGGTRNITIRNCDIYWIGGGLQYWANDGKGHRYPVRFGNGIEFWGGCRNNLVERNRLWQIYDAALTNQTKDNPHPNGWEVDITWRDNVVWQAEYSFEYWNHDPRSYTGNILVEHNTFVDAGYCWSHSQRPNPNGAHLMLYDNAAATTNFVVRNNVFVRTTDRSTRMFNDWRAKPGSSAGLTMRRNLYCIPANAILEYHVNGREKAAGMPIRTTPARYGAGPEEFARYQADFGLDQESVYGEPQFVDEAKRDYRLKPGSFGTSLATDGGPLGARNMPGLDRDQSESE